MNIATYFRAQAHNNAWANHRLLTACGTLRPEELSAVRTNFFPSILLTLNHTVMVDRFYVAALDGMEQDEDPFGQDISYDAFPDLDRAQRAVDHRLIVFCDDLKDDILADTVTLPRDGWVQTERVDRVLLHLFQHQIHHRGQVHAMLAGTPVAPPQLDEFFLNHAKEQDLRAPDFKALGFDEETIWRP